MIVKTHIPRFPLNQFVDYFLYYEGYQPEHQIDRFLPDGNTEIIIDISQDCGFYDQAHFINDFKFFSGFTPEEYVRRKNDVLNYVPVG